MKMNYRLWPAIATLALVTLALAASAWAQNVPGQPQAHDPQIVQAQLRQELGKAMYEAGQFQGQAAQLSAALKKAQDDAAGKAAWWASYVKGLSPVAEAKPAEPQTPAMPPRPHGPPAKP